MYVYVHAHISSTYILVLQETPDAFGNKTQDSEYTS